MAANELISSSSGSNPDIVVKQKFDKATASYADYMLNHKGRDNDITDIKNDHDILGKSIINENGKYSDYVEYGMKDYATSLEKGVDKNLTPTFNQFSYNLSIKELQEIKKHINIAAKNNNLMWKTVISFSDDFLVKQKIMDNVHDRNLDQKRLKIAIKNQMKDYLKSEGIEESAEWFGNIHLRGDQNQKHIHVHLAIFEQETNREMKLNPVTNKLEPRGLFKQKHLDKFKSNVLKAAELEKNLQIERELLITKSIIEKDDLDVVSQMNFYKQECQYINALLNLLPDDKKKWRAKSNSIEMKSANEIANKIVDNFLNHSENSNLEKYNDINSQLQKIYTNSYGKNSRTDNFVNKRLDDFKNKLINRMYKTLKEIPESDYRFENNLDNLEKHQEIKISLENKLKELKRKKQDVPKKLVKELGMQRRAIKIINVKSMLEDVEIGLDQLNNFNDELSTFYKEQLKSEKEYLKLNLLPNFKLSQSEQVKKKELKIDFMTIENVDVNKVDENFYQLKNRKIKSELDLILKEPDNALKALFKENKNQHIEKLKIKQKILNDKFSINKNNNLLNNKNIDNQKKREILNLNRRYFEHIKYLKNSNGQTTVQKKIPDINDKGNLDQNIEDNNSSINKNDELFNNDNIDPKNNRENSNLNNGKNYFKKFNYKTRKKTRIKLNMSKVISILDSLSNQKSISKNDINSDEIALNAFEQEQNRIEQLEREKTR